MRPSGGDESREKKRRRIKPSRAKYLLTARQANVHGHGPWCMARSPFFVVRFFRARAGTMAPHLSTCQPLTHLMTWCPGLARETVACGRTYRTSAPSRPTYMEKCAIRKVVVPTEHRFICGAVANFDDFLTFHTGLTLGGEFSWQRMVRFPYLVT